MLDPFAGAGTVALVAARLGRSTTLVELKPEYADIAEKRLRGNVGLLAPLARE